MNKFTIIFAIVLLSVSCGRMSDKKIAIEAMHRIVIDESKLNIKHKASDVFSDVTFVPLKTSDSVLVGNIGKIIPIGDKFALSKTSSTFLIESKINIIFAAKRKK